MFVPQVQFGHAGACANQASETAVAKNTALKEAGAFVPKSFDELGDIIKSVHSVQASSSDLFNGKDSHVHLRVFLMNVDLCMTNLLPKELSNQPKSCLPPPCQWITPGPG